ncbi:MAG: hypothetical protein M3068_03865 [Gemmatimonadota bacterium]|nr:hypothetical protein [Gemmatimonadota bacterium]
MPRRRVPWAAFLSAALLLAWLAATPPIHDLERDTHVVGASLRLSPAFLLLAPLCDSMDALSLLSVTQSVALVVGAITLYALWRAARRAPRSAGSELRAGVRLLGVIVAFYGAAALAPRPMAALALDDPDALAVDFHSHTNASHDGRPDFTASRNVAWHRAAGFNASYITDHASFDGVAAAERENPRRAADGVVSLSGLELIYRDEHINVLGLSESDQRFLTLPAPAPAPSPPSSLLGAVVLLQTIPEDLSRVPVADRAGRRGVQAIELSDGAPRGIAQAQRDHDLILRIADSLDLSVVAGSNNHGWGRTAVAWSVMTLPGWRALSPRELGAAIQHRMTVARRRAVRVIGRRTPDPRGSGIALALTLPAVIWSVLTTMSPAERLSWIAWAWVLWMAPRLRVRRAARPFAA